MSNTNSTTRFSWLQSFQWPLVFPPLEMRDMLVLHRVARAKILAFQARINPVSHPRERLPLPVSNELHWRCSPTTKPSLCINSTSRVRAYVGASVSSFVFPFRSRRLRPMYSRRRNSKPSGSDRDRSLPRRKTARMIDCQQVGNSSGLVHRVIVDTTEITRGWSIIRA